MFHWSGSVDIDCDAPPYPIVRACRKLGFQEPEDVRWCRLDRLLDRPITRLELFNPQTWKAFFGLNEVPDRTCTCGQDLPALEQYTFTLSSARQLNYLLGQCCRCRKIYWDAT